MQNQNITCLWNYDNKYPVLSISAIIRSYDCSPNESQVSCGLDNIIRTFDYQEFKTVGSDLIGHITDITAVKYSKDGLLIASGSGDTLYLSAEYFRGIQDFSVRVWDSKTRQQVSQNLLGHTKAIMSVVFSSESEFVISGSDDSSIRVWDWKLGSQVNIINTNCTLVTIIQQGFNIIACNRSSSSVQLKQLMKRDSGYSTKLLLVISAGFRNNIIRISSRFKQKYGRLQYFRIQCNIFDYQYLSKQIIITNRSRSIYILDALSRKLSRKINQLGFEDIKFALEYRFVVIKRASDKLCIIPYSY